MGDLPFQLAEGGASDPPAPGSSYIESIRERPPLRLNIDIETPDGGHQRLGSDDPEPGNAPMGLSTSSVMPGGFERCSFTLECDSRLTYPDLAELSTVTVRGVGGDIAWQGRLEKTPDTGGFQEQVSPEAVGWQAHLEDDNTAREIFVDRELSKWEGPGLQRQINTIKEAFTSSGPSVATSPQTSAPGVALAVTAPWLAATRPRAEAWYDARGIPLGLLGFAWSGPGALGKVAHTESGSWINPTDEDWDWRAHLSHDSVASAFDSTVPLRGYGPGAFDTLPAGNAERFFAYVELFYTIASEGRIEDSALCQLFWENLAVYGRHGLPLYGPNPQGVLASDAVAYALSKWAPKLAFTTGPEGTIKPSSFVIPQLAFPEPTTVAEMLKQAIRFELQDWAVWEGPTFHMNSRGEGGKEWRPRVGPAQLQEAGPQVARLFNGCIVVYTDAAGTQRTVGPPGSGAEATSGLLIDEDPENPLNEIGIKKYAKLSMGTTTLAGAEQVGSIFLRESRALESAGQATLVGHVEDASGVLYPAWAVRGGDTVSFLDASDPSPRRIVHASYEESSRSCQIQLDQPPDSMTAILERLSVSLIGTGLS